MTFCPLAIRKNLYSFNTKNAATAMAPNAYGNAFDPAPALPPPPFPPPPFGLVGDGTNGCGFDTISGLIKGDSVEIGLLTITGSNGMG